MKTKLTPKDIIELYQLVLHYLHGQALEVIQVRLQTLCSRLETNGEDLYQSVLLNETEEFSLYSDYIKATLESLNESSDNDSIEVSDTNLHQFLSHLCREDHPHLIRLLKMIDNTKPKKSWTFLLMMGATASAGLAGFAYSKKESVDAMSQWLAKHFPIVIRWLEKTFSLLRNYHLLSGVVNLLRLAWEWYCTLTNQRTTQADKLDTLIFKTLSASLTITAYLLCFFAAGTATPAAIGLFVLSAATKFIQNAWQAWHLTEPLLEQPHPTWAEEAERRRAQNFYERRQASAWIKICASIFTTISVSILYAFHLSFVVSVCFMLFNLLLGLTEASILSNNDEKSDSKLQTAIDTIEILMDPKLKPSQDANEATFIEQIRGLNTSKLEIESNQERFQKAREKLDESIRQHQQEKQAFMVWRNRVIATARQTGAAINSLFTEMEPQPSIQNIPRSDSAELNSNQLIEARESPRGSSTPLTDRRSSKRSLFAEPLSPIDQQRASTGDNNVEELTHPLTD